MVRRLDPSKKTVGLFPSLGSPSEGRFLKNGDLNRLLQEDRPIHQWYRFVLSFPPHLVRDYVSRFELTPKHRVLDPFCGTGTTLVECKKLGVPSVGVEALPMAHFASRVKIDWSPDPDELLEHAKKVAERAIALLERDGISDPPTPSRVLPRIDLRTLPQDKMQVLLADSISPLPLHKALVLLGCLAEYRDDRYHGHELLALAKALVTSVGNLHFGPEVGVGAPKADAPVVASWLRGIEVIAGDLALVRKLRSAPAIVHLGDSRQIARFIQPGSIDGVFTSPPYPNEKDYTRTTRLESVLLGFIENKEDLRLLKEGLVRSNTRNVYKDDDDDRWIANHPEVERIARDIETRRLQLGKTSGFERLYPRVTKLYFGGMARHLSELRQVLRPGARLAYVVGDQASYLRVLIRTGQLLADIAESFGYKVAGVQLFRTRLATATREQLREEVVVLRWPG